VGNIVLGNRKPPGEPAETPPKGRKYKRTVFSDLVMGTTPVFTSPRFDSLLGQEDALGLEVVTRQVTGGGTPAMTVDVLHSCDRESWIVSHTGVVAFWISTTGPSFFWAPVTEPPVGLGFRRLRITLIPVGGTGLISARVTVGACGRNVGT
jgi:hypothetical protein